MVRRRDHDESIRRRSPFREPKHRILVVCEGRATEPRYFKWFQHEARNRLVHVEINDDAGVPKTLVERSIELRDTADAEARRQRDENLRFDEVWCVFDVDEHPNLAAACEQARVNQIAVAVSNPCFELWALLHVRDQTGWIHRHAAQQEVRKHFPRYEKVLPAERLAPGYADAVRRAKELDEAAARDGQPGRNPTTGVYRLTERIKRYGQP